MEYANILDAKEEERFFLYGNHSLCCFGVNIICLGIIALISIYVRESTILSKILEFFASFLLVMVVQLTLVGCYYSIQGVRLKETKTWRAVLGFVLHLSLIVIFYFSLTST